jgi:putative two-component system response regulator
MSETMDASGRSTILVVDDTPENLSLMSGLLRDLYKVKVANNGDVGLQIASAEKSPDLILLDIMMPGIDGYEVCARLKKNTKTADIPVIFLTSRSEVEDEKRGLEIGAVDYITKPISPPIVLARVKTHLTLKAAADFLRDKNAFLEGEVQRRTAEVSTIQDVTMLGLASLAETRDNETGNHLRRTQNYVRALATQLRDSGQFLDYLTPSTIQTLYKSAPLHDIGKVGIPDNILLKPGKLTSEEFEIMKTHVTLGRNAIVAAEKLLDSPNSFLQCAREIAYAHHEKWDGSGYPEGLAGENIPISARMMAVADVYDALISRRVYKEAFPYEEAVKIIRKGRGSHFDPALIDAFDAIESVFHSIAQRYADDHNRGG